MRTSIITAVGHDGKGVLISGKEVGLLKNIELFKEFRKIAVLDGSHEDYASVSHQENDGSEQLLNFRTPDAHKKHLAERGKEKKAHADAIAAQAESEAKPRAAAPAPDVEAEEKKAAEFMKANAEKRDAAAKAAKK
jgi:uncharacterized membrane protein